MTKQSIKLSLIATGMCLALSATAQQGVKIVDAPYLPNAKTVDDVIGANPLTSSSGGKAISTQPQQVAAVAETAPVKTATAVAFEVLATDRTIRDVLQRWARASGWKHDQVHWALLRDYPVQGTASAEHFGGDFKSAVRLLLSSTEATDLPAQPCFYTNLVVRVVPQAEICDRTAANAQ